MLQQVDTRVPSQVEKQVLDIYRRLYPDGEMGFVPRVFDWAQQFFSGRYADYQPIDAKYHDFEHTLQGALCLVRLLLGMCTAKAKPEIPQHMFELCLLGILFHDTGYLKKRDDIDGTGAKYTPIHVMRSVAFAQEFLAAKAFTETDLQSIQNMIRCTGLNVDLKSVPFQSDVERTLGFALGTADLLGQMAAPDYIDKLPVLYLEFAEAARHDREPESRFAQYHGPEDLIRRTPAFWQNYVWPRINDDFGRVYVFLNDPFPDGPNPYLEAIQKNIERLNHKPTAV